MKSTIYTENSEWQTISHEWYGKDVAPGLEYTFELTREYLCFRARRAKAAMVHPDGRSGQFQAELWRYDAAEFFITTPDGERYMEFNLSPNGAWWTCVFSAPRVADETCTDWRPEVKAKGESGADGWESEAYIPLAALAEIGIDPRKARLATCSILESPEQIFLTTAKECDCEPDFHRPDLWEEVIVK